jgi:hypothetical protein
MLVDLLGHPIEAGMKVLTSSYAASGDFIVTEVVRVTKKVVIISIPRRIYSNSLKKMEWVNHELRRHSSKVFFVDNQLKHNKNKYPEYSL